MINAHDGIMEESNKYIDMTYQAYNDSLRLLNRGDIYDAAEKAWCAIENARKAFLVTIGVPPKEASSIEFGVTFFHSNIKNPWS